MFKSTKGLLSLFFISLFISLFLILSLEKKEEDQFQILSEARLLLEKLNSDILMLRRHEKDFLSRKNNKYIILFNKTHRTIQTHILILIDDLQHEKIDSYLLALESMYIKTSSPEALFTLKKTFLKEIKITELSSEERLPAVSSNKDATQDESIKDASKEEVTLVKEIFEKVKYLNHLKQTHIKAQTVSDKEMQTLASLRANTISAYLESVHKVNKEAIVIKDFKVFINKDETKWIKTEMGITVKQK